MIVRRHLSHWAWVRRHVWIRWCKLLFFFFSLPRHFLVLSRSFTHFPDLSHLCCTNVVGHPSSGSPARTPPPRRAQHFYLPKLGLFHCRPDSPSARGTWDGARCVAVGGLDDDVGLATEDVMAEVDASVGEALAVLFSILWVLEGDFFSTLLFFFQFVRPPWTLNNFLFASPLCDWQKAVLLSLMSIHAITPCNKVHKLFPFVFGSYVQGFYFLFFIIIIVDINYMIGIFMRVWGENVGI